MNDDFAIVMHDDSEALSHVRPADRWRWDGVLRDIGFVTGAAVQQTINAQSSLIAASALHLTSSAALTSGWTVERFAHPNPAINLLAFRSPDNDEVGFVIKATSRNVEAFPFGTFSGRDDVPLDDALGRNLSRQSPVAIFRTTLCKRTSPGLVPFMSLVGGNIQPDPAMTVLDVISEFVGEFDAVERNRLAREESSQPYLADVHGEVPLSQETRNALHHDPATPGSTIRTLVQRIWNIGLSDTLSRHKTALQALAEDLARAGNDSEEAALDSESSLVYALLTPEGRWTIRHISDLDFEIGISGDDIRLVRITPAGERLVKADIVKSIDGGWTSSSIDTYDQEASFAVCKMLQEVIYMAEDLDVAQDATDDSAPSAAFT